MIDWRAVRRLVPEVLRSWPSDTLLERRAPNPMATLNRAVALAMVQGPAAGLPSTPCRPTSASPRPHLLVSVRAHLLAMAGNRAQRAPLPGARRPYHPEPEAPRVAGLIGRRDAGEFALFCEIITAELG